MILSKIIWLLRGRCLRCGRKKTWKDYDGMMACNTCDVRHYNRLVRPQGRDFYECGCTDGCWLLPGLISLGEHIRQEHNSSIEEWTEKEVIRLPEYRSIRYK